MVLGVRVCWVVGLFASWSFCVCDAWQAHYVPFRNARQACVRQEWESSRLCLPLLWGPYVPDPLSCV